MIIPIFPTLILKKTIDIDWNQNQILKYLDEYFLTQIQTNRVERDLHRIKVFGPLVQYMNSAVKEYWKELDYDPGYPIEISQMWANKYEKNASYPHNLENDSPSIITVVFYVSKESAEQGNLFFQSPNELLLQTQPLSSNRRYNTRFQEFDGRTGDLVCFPSWLQHGIQPNSTDIPRYSVAANYELKGLTTIKKMMNKI